MIQYFSKDHKSTALPKKFTYPFFYQPHDLARVAAEELQQKLLEHAVFQNLDKGRMFGVLVVQNEDGNLGYLQAYSGELQLDFESITFVPPIYTLPKGDEFKEMAGINKISKSIKTLEGSSEYLVAQNSFSSLKAEVEANISAKRTAMKEAKKDRKKQRKKAEQELSLEAQQLLLNQLAAQSQEDGYALKRFVRAENERLAIEEKKLKIFQDEITSLKEERKRKSAQLQQEIFDAYRFLNARGEENSVQPIFQNFGVEIPPAGAGECAAPKLLQAAYKLGLKPIALAEFWWGPSPDSEIRKHLQYYPACKGKCKPILSFMMQGLDVDEDPLLVNFGEGKALEIVYEDDQLVVVNKPHGLLSVPGIEIQDSVLDRMQKAYPEATGPMVVHRLDQDTSGLMIVAKDKDSHKHLQEQFQDRTIQKAYVALVEGTPKQSKGTIDLPLRTDYNRRPMQVVCYEYGKRALTHYEVLESNGDRSMLKLKPITGRSHQLRVHCAHHKGLNTPMVGDNLYGNIDERLCLHAQEIKFVHPEKQNVLKFSTSIPF